jgi:hypothetical protein
VFTKSKLLSTVQTNDCTRQATIYAIQAVRNTAAFMDQFSKKAKNELVFMNLVNIQLILIRILLTNAFSSSAHLRFSTIFTAGTILKQLNSILWRQSKDDCLTS